MRITKWKKQLYDVLLTPIECSRSIECIVCRDGRVFSPQRYCYAIDPDMSDFAVGFYEVLYQPLLSGNRLLNDDGFFFDVEFAGDSMNSFNTVANTILGDSDAKHRSPMNKWPTELLRFHERFRSLANYWLIPMRLGRTGTKLNKYDSLDLFLKKLELNFPKFQEQEQIQYRGFQSKNYFRHFVDYQEFSSIHYAERTLEPSEIAELYKSKDGCMRLACEMSSNIERRAWRIAESEALSAALWKWFCDLGLISKEDGNR